MGLNVYEDLGYPDAEAMLLKAGLVHQIQQTLKAQAIGLSQAGKMIGADPAVLNEYLHGGFREVSAEVLVQYLSRLGQNVEVVVSSRSADQHQVPTVTVRRALEQNAA